MYENNLKHLRTQNETLDLYNVYQYQKYARRMQEIEQQKIQRKYHDSRTKKNMTSEFFRPWADAPKKRESQATKKQSKATKMRESLNDLKCVRIKQIKQSTSMCMFQNTNTNRINVVSNAYQSQKDSLFSSKARLHQPCLFESFYCPPRTEHNNISDAATSIGTITDDHISDTDDTLIICEDNYDEPLDLRVKKKPPRDDDVPTIHIQIIADFTPPNTPISQPESLPEENIKRPKSKKERTKRRICIACNRKYQKTKSLRWHFKSKIHQTRVEKLGIEDPANCPNTWYTSSHNNEELMDLEEFPEPDMHTGE